MRGLNPRPARKLSRAALAFRTFHAAIALEQLLAIAYVWWSALTGRRDRMLRIAAATLIGEGVLVTANRGDCPLGGLQRRLGDPVPLFELVLSRRAAKRAVPTLGAITAAEPPSGEAIFFLVPSLLFLPGQFLGRKPQLYPGRVAGGPP